MTTHTPVAECESGYDTFTVHSKVVDRSPLRQSVIDRHPRDDFLADFLMRNKGFIQTLRARRLRVEFAVSTGDRPMPAPEGTTMTDNDTTLEVEVTEVAIEIVEPEATRAFVIRHLLERQLGAGQSLGAQLVGASTDVSAALVHAPATVVDEIRSGATLPAALALTGAEVRGVVSSTGTRVRTAIGDYVGTQATLPNAVVVGAADVAEAVLRAQGTVAGSAIDSVFTVATTAARGGDVRDAAGRERRDIAARANAARANIAESWEHAAEEIRAAVKDYDEYVEASPDEV